MANNIQNKNDEAVEAKKTIYLKINDERKVSKAAKNITSKQIRPQQKLKKIVGELKIFIKSNFGEAERLIEKIISEEHINCKHNPYYSGSFNGNDFM